MHWIAPSEKDTEPTALKNRLLDAGEQAMPALPIAESQFNNARSERLPDLIFLRFAAIAAQSFRLIHKLHLRIQTLRRTRDLLLPRLLSGQVNLEVN